MLWTAALACLAGCAVRAVPLTHHRAEGIQLVAPGGQTTGQIVVPDEPSWIENAAASEIGLQLFKATGANVTIVHHSHAVSGRPTLYVGKTEGSSAHPLPLEAEGYSIFVAPDAAHVLGDDECNATWPHKVTDNSECRRGTLFGAFALLRHLGFAWLWPGTGGQVIPDLAATGVTLKTGLNLSDAPELAMRRYRPIYSNTAEVYGRYANKVPFLINHTLIQQLAEDESQWLVHAGMGSHGTPSWGQAFGSWWNEWGANGTFGHHPEWFALLPPNTTVNPSPVARRGPWMHDGHFETSGVKMCVSNAELHAQIAKGYINGTPGVSACEDDGDQGFCTCAKCRAWDALTQGPDSSCFNHSHPDWKHVPEGCRGQYSDRYAQFWDSVAAVLAKLYPESPPTVTGYAYDNYRDPPLNYTITGNVMVGLVVGVFGDANSTARDKALWSGWHDHGANKMFWRPNIGGASGVGPLQGSKAMVSTLKWLAEHGLDATDMDSMVRQIRTHQALGRDIPYCGPLQSCFIVKKWTNRERYALQDNHWAQSGFTYFVTAHAQWHPKTFSRDSALAKYCAVGFGQHAAGIAKEYIEFWESWSSSAARASIVLQHPGLTGMPFLYTEQLLSKAAAILLRLEANCNNYRGCAEKVKFWSVGLQHARLTTAAIVAQNQTAPCATDRACAISGGSLPSALALLQYRRQIAASSAVNVFEQSMAEVNDHDVTGIAAAAELEPLMLPKYTPAVQLTVNDWMFAFDEHGVGETSPTPWYSPKEPTKHGGANGTRWKRMTVGVPWNRTIPGRQWAEGHGGEAYTGVGWYRTLFETTLLGNATKESELVLVANVTGSAKAWVNGLPLSSVPSASSAVGVVAFDLTKEVKRTGKGSVYQEVAVRIDGHNKLRGAGVVSSVFVLRGA